MRLSAWTSLAPDPRAVNPRVLGVIVPVLQTLGAEPDPHALVVWGDEPAARFDLMVLTAAGVIVCHVRPDVPGEGPRATAKLVRWARLAITEPAVETSGGHRILSLQVENIVLRAADEAADRIGTFVRAVFAGQDGLPFTGFEDEQGTGHRRRGDEPRHDEHDRDDGGFEHEDEGTGPGVIELPTGIPMPPGSGGGSTSGF